MAATGGENDIYIAIGVQTDQLRVANELVLELANNLAKLSNVQLPTGQTGEAIKAQLATVGEDFGKLGKKAKENAVIIETAFKNALPEGADWNAGALTAEFQKLDRAELTNASLTRVLANAHKMDVDVLRQFEPIVGMTAEQMQNSAQAVEKNNDSYRKMRMYLRNARAAIGPLGYAFRDVTMQVYWAALGFLFLTMTVTRAEQAQLTAARRANDLAKQYYNLIVLEREATRAVIEYGSGSAEAGEAAVRLQMAEKDLEMQQKSLAIAIKAEVLQGYQQTLSLIPLVVNTTWMLYSGIAALTGLMNTSLQVKMTDVAVDNMSTEAKKKNAVQEAVNTGLTLKGIGAKLSSMVANAKLAISQHTLGVALANSAFWANVLIGALTLGIGAAISFAATSIMMANAEAEAQKQIAEMTDTMKEQGTEWGEMSAGMSDFQVPMYEVNIGVTGADDAKAEVEGLSGALTENDYRFRTATQGASGYSEEVAGKSVDSAALMAAEAIGLLNDNLSATDTEGAIQKLSDLSNYLNDMSGEKKFSVQVEKLEIPRVEDISINLIPNMRDLDEINKAITEKMQITPTQIPGQVLNREAITNNETNNSYFVEIHFNGITVRGTGDIDEISYAIDKVFQQNVHAVGGEV